MNPVTIPDIGTLSKIAVTDGLGILLAIANLIVLVMIVRWVLKTGHARETALATIINTSLVESQKTLAALTKQIETLDNHQTTFMEFLKNLDMNVRERWVLVQKTADYQRADITKVGEEVLRLKERVVCTHVQPKPN